MYVSVLDMEPDRLEVDDGVRLRVSDDSELRVAVGEGERDNDRLFTEDGDTLIVSERDDDVDFVLVASP